MNLTNFFAELKRRNVYKVAVAYGIVGWLVMQVAATVVPALHLPSAITSAVVLLTLLGFPIALVLAWAFELTAEGIKRTEEVAPNESITRRTGRKVTALIVIAAVIATALLAFQFLRTPKLPSAAVQIVPSTAAGTIPQKSIAVLPFASLSEDKANAYFANGIQDEILTRLAKIADLKVISRTSTQQYQSKPGNLPEIAKQLGVAHILEGSVQKAGDAVRINVQLIEAHSDNHLWAETYDRQMADVFAVESEVAQKIANSLRATLTGHEKSALDAKSTNNSAAYEAYLRGRVFSAGSGWIQSNVEGAIESYQQAVALDPGFALAWARLSYEQIWSYWQGFDPSPARLAAAKNATDHAVAIEPDLPEVRLALGFYRYYGQRDFPAALAEFRWARQGLPNDSGVTKGIAFIQRRMGNFEESITEFRRSIELDPRDVNTYQDLALTYECLRRFPAALATVETALALQPMDTTTLSSKASLLWRSSADLQAVEKLLENTATSPEIIATQALFQRRFPEAIAALSTAKASPRRTQRTVTMKGGGYLPERQQLLLLLGLAQQRAGETAAARVTYQQTVEEIRGAIASAGSGSNVEVALHAALGEALSHLGEADAAIEEGRKAIVMRPASTDALNGPAYEENLARIYGQLGDADHAISLLQRLLQIPYHPPITPALLRLDPAWDPIRNHPRFQDLSAGKTKP